MSPGSEIHKYQFRNATQNALLIVFRVATFLLTIVAIYLGTIWPSLLTLGALISLPCLVTCWFFQIPKGDQRKKMHVYTLVVCLYTLVVCLYALVVDVWFYVRL